MEATNPLADRLEEFLLQDTLNVACVGAEQATRDQLIERGDEMAKAIRSAIDEIKRLEALIEAIEADDRTGGA